MSIPPNTAVVITDPYNDFLHPEGKTQWFACSQFGKNGHDRASERDDHCGKEEQVANL